MYSKNFLITGAASGIGRHLATVLADDGRWVMATDVDEAGLERSARQKQWDVTGVRTAVMDVTEPDDWRRVVDRVVEERGRLDVLINAAGYLEPGYVHEIDPDEIELQVDINLKGTMYGTRIVGEQMVDQETGHIVNFGSLASMAPVPGLGIYSGSKFGVRGFTIAAAQELRAHEVDVTVVMPDAVDTEMLEKQADYEEAAISFSGSDPLTVEDIEEAMFERVLPDRPLEVALPATRGGIARLTNLVPQVLRLFDPLFRKLGLSGQKAYRDGSS
jgi:3-oxoacyl-[acyl-carrier protein] reductase